MAAKVSLRTAIGLGRRFLGLAGGYWRGPGGWPAWLLTGALFLLTVAQVFVPVMINLWSQRLFDALEQRAPDRLLTMILAAGGIILFSVGVTVAHLRVKRRLQLGWRAWLTRRLLDRWLSDGREERLAALADGLDNPDGRIAEDIRIATELAIDLGHSLTYCALLLAGFTNILWALSGPAELEVAGVTLVISGYLLVMALLFAAAGAGTAMLLGRPLVRAVERRQGWEAGFRFGLAHVRENAPAIAALHGEPAERNRLAALFTGVRRGWNRQTNALTGVMSFGAAYSVLSTAFPILVAAPGYIAGRITLGVLMQTAQAFQQTVAALSWPVDNLANVAQWAASVERVLGLDEALQNLDPP
ncbi:ABC transporter ATP-binding protein/permease [Azospirillum canadense]|uniref:ABC transporter ATP-binding protein/permease n=1 Tax=Azospirillum canadense TaxID=403962 RepID=UPI0022269606|nr:SbmA/BacA-like family transporter [Azospirillum canadense]MCW2237618.1 putative ATP-binding cassette transporter [Azospirillum canadense]